MGWVDKGGNGGGGGGRRGRNIECRHDVKSVHLLIPYWLRMEVEREGGSPRDRSRLGELMSLCVYTTI